MLYKDQYTLPPTENSFWNILFFYKNYIYLRFLTSGRTADPATLFSHSSVPRVLCVCVGGGGRVFEVKSTVEGEATVPSRIWGFAAGWEGGWWGCWGAEMDDGCWACGVGPERGWADEAGCCDDDCFFANLGGSFPPPPLPFSPLLFLLVFCNVLKV